MNGEKPNPESSKTAEREARKKLLNIRIRVLHDVMQAWYQQGTVSIPTIRDLIKNIESRKMFKKPVDAPGLLDEQWHILDDILRKELPVTTIIEDYEEELKQLG